VQDILSVKITNLSKKFSIHRENKKTTTLKEFFLNKMKGQNTYEDFYVLKNINLEIGEGETFGIIGENWAGKSTLLKIICGILKPTEGAVTVRGEVAALLELGTGFQPELTGRENVYLNASLLGLKRGKVDKLFDRIVAFSELEKFIDMRISKYSSGMYMRLGFSIAVHVDPDILLIDEILSVGDEYFRQKCHRKIEDFRKRGKTIIIVTHDLDAIKKWCHRAAWLRQGGIKDLGDPPRVIEYYLAETAKR